MFVNRVAEISFLFLMFLNYNIYNCVLKNDLPKVVLGTQFSEAKGNGSSKTNHFTILLVWGVC